VRTYLDIRNRLVQARKAAHLTQAQVAEHLCIAECTFADYENRRPSMSVERLLELVDLYNVSIEWVMTGVNPRFDPQQLAEAVGVATAQLAHLQAAISKCQSAA